MKCYKKYNLQIDFLAIEPMKHMLLVKNWLKPNTALIFFHFLADNANEFDNQFTTLWLPDDFSEDRFLLIVMVLIGYHTDQGKSNLIFPYNN